MNQNIYNISFNNDSLFFEYERKKYKVDLKKASTRLYHADDNL